MNSIEHVKKSIEKIIARSNVPEDPVHSKNTLAWLLRLKPDADEALQIAALGHDIDRAMEHRKVRRRDFEDYDQFKAAHASNSAVILREIMDTHGLTVKIANEVCRLVCRHEVGGDERSDLLKDADSISFFDVNLPFYYRRSGWDETKRRCRWGYERLSDKMKSVAAQLPFEDHELDAILKSTIEASRKDRLKPFHPSRRLSAYPNRPGKFDANALNLVGLGLHFVS